MEFYFNEVVLYSPYLQYLGVQNLEPGLMKRRSILCNQSLQETEYQVPLFHLLPDYTAHSSSLSHTDTH